MTRISEVQPPKNILIIGGSGTGKTSLIGSLIKLVPTLLVTSDLAGVETLRTMGVDTEIVHIESWANIWDYYKEIAEKSKEYAAIAIDDFGAAQKSVVDKIALEPRNWKEEKLAGQKGASAFRNDTMEQIMSGDRVLELQQYNLLSTATDSFASAILKLPFRLKLFTCLEASEDNPRTGEKHLYPALMGRARVGFSARFSLVAESFTATLSDKLYYCLSCHSHQRLETKTRFGQGRTWVNPTMEKLLAHIARKGEIAEITEELKIGVGL